MQEKAQAVIWHFCKNTTIIFSIKGDFSKFIEFGAENSQWWSGMGVAVIFGLFFATALTLVVVPVLYYMLSDAVVVLLEKLGWQRKEADAGEAAVEKA